MTLIPYGRPPSSNRPRHAQPWFDTGMPFPTKIPYLPYHDVGSRMSDTAVLAF